MPTHFFKRHPLGGSPKASWHDVQDGLALGRRRRGARRVKALILLGVFPALVAAAVYLAVRGPAGLPGRKAAEEPSTRETRAIQSQTDLQQVLDPRTLFNPSSASLEIEVDGRPLTVETSLDLDLQEFLLERLDRAHSRYIGIVAMEIDTGRVRVMTGFNKIDPAANPCIESGYPAASIFKIVTASAAVEAAGLSPDSPLLYNGRKHTLYKSQLKPGNDRHTHQTTLRESFAESINPVFGKIGTQRLGKSELEKYAQALGFNREIPFDLPLNPSELRLSDEPYQWAEIASGFNRETTLSPLHGAVIVATLLNGGQWVAPTVIDRIRGENGETVYNRQTTVKGQVLTPETSRALKEMMIATITSGTGKRAFRGYRQDKVLSRLAIGGKTGSIFNKARDARFDWFVGYAQDENQGKGLAVSVVVAHEEYIGTRAAQYARIVMRAYFDEHFAGDGKGSGTTG